MYEVEHISISIARTPQDVYHFASNPLNLPLWAAGLAQSEVKQDGDCWMVEAPFGKAKIKFVENNSLGVMDHAVELESGLTVNNPMRVVANGEGAEFIFTLIRQPNMTDEEFAADKLAITQDLHTLKRLLEQR